MDLLVELELGGHCPGVSEVSVWFPAPRNLILRGGCKN